MNKVVTRFPPSPTGFLHIGGLRTALYNYLFARKHQGTFVLRVEDTDRTRYVEGAVESLIRTLNAVGLEYDEGPMFDENGNVIEKGEHGPYKQSDRLPIYKKYAEQLIEKGSAYYCFCSPERLEELRETQTALKQPTKYDRHCLSIPAEEAKKRAASEPHVIRLKMPEGETIFHDEIRGTIKIDNREVDDQVLIKTDGFPTYHMAVVVDDYSMNVTHVIRGEEWISSVPKHIALYEMFGFPKPVYAHLPLILNKDRSKLSKRQGDVAVEDFLAKGYLPEALINYVALLGFNPTGDREIYSMDEFIASFDLTKINKSGAIFDLDKLNWINGHYIRQKSTSDICVLGQPYLDETGIQIDPFFFARIVEIEKERLELLKDLSTKVVDYLNDPQYDASLLIWKKADAADAKMHLLAIEQIIQKLSGDVFADRGLIEQAIKRYIEDGSYQNGNVLWPLRAALSGKDRSPNPFELLWIFGKEESLKRIHQALSLLS